jgi:hypothetical protein
MRVCLILLICLSVAACSSKAPGGLWSEPELDAARLSEGIIIGGVVDLTAELDLFDQQQDAELLHTALDTERPGLAVGGWGDARSTLDPDSLDATLADYRLSGRLSATHLRQLAVLTDQARYIALARIDLDQTTWDYPRRVRETGDRTVVDLEPESRRKISLVFDLYDLKLARLAYTIPLERTGVEHGSTHTVEGINAVPTETEVRDAVEELHRTSDRTEPADRDGLVRAMLRKAVKYLPTK